MSPANLAGAPDAFSGLARRANSKMRVSFGPCVAQEAKKGLFSGPALRRKQKRVSFGALRYAGSKKGSLSGPALRRKQKRVSFRALRYAGSKKGSLSGPALRRKQKRVSFRALRYAGSKKGSLSGGQSREWILLARLNHLSEVTMNKNGCRRYQDTSPNRRANHVRGQEG